MLDKVPRDIYIAYNCKTYVNIYYLYSKNPKWHQQLKMLCLRWESSIIVAFICAVFHKVQCVHTAKYEDQK